MNKFNLNNNHPLIPNQNTYLCEKKYISICSEDRDIIKYPNASLFEIELPEDYNNVQKVSLDSWSFPSNYSVFTNYNDNLRMVFKFNKIYNPSSSRCKDVSPLQNAIYEGLIDFQEKNPNGYIITIEEGFYNPEQMATELTNKMNSIVTQHLIDYISNNIWTKWILISLFKGYTEFVVVYNSVNQKLWFGNKSSSFIIDNNSPFYKINQLNSNIQCTHAAPIYTNWGLPYFLGFTRESQYSISSSNVYDYKFYYGDIFYPGDNGVWISSDVPDGEINYLVCPLKINFMGPSYLYMELSSSVSFNNIDELIPYNTSKFTETTNQSNGVVNASFAKIPVCSTPISQYYDNESRPYKWFEPPAERIRKLKVKLRYHDGSLVDFSNYNYSFMLELSMLIPQIERKIYINHSCI